MLRVTDAQRRARLAHNHRLVASRRTDAVEHIVESLVCLHSSDPATVFLSALARMQNPSIDAIEDALYRRRTLLRHHGMRRTIWIYPRALAPHVHAAATLEIAAKEWATFSKELGSQRPARWTEAAVESLLELLRSEGPLPARQVGKLRPDLAVKITRGTGKYEVEQSAHTRLLLNLGFDGRAVRADPTGAWTSGEYRWTALDRWLPGALSEVPKARAEAVVIEGYLAAFGPVTITDVAWWTGWSKARVTAALDKLPTVPAQLDDGSQGLLLESDVGAVFESETSVALLPSLDPTAMGWKQREWYLGPHGVFGDTLVDRAGNIGPTVWLDGRVIGGWMQRPDGKVAYELLENLPKSRQKVIAEEAARVEAFIGPARVNVRFPVPLQKRLR